MIDHVLAGRRSCRSFRSDPLPDDEVWATLEAVRRAPSAGNSAVPSLVVLDTPERVGAYWDVTLPPDRRARFRWPGLLRAPLLVIPVVHPAAYVERYAEPDKASSGLGHDESDWSVPYWWVDGGAAVMAILLAATARGWGSLLFGQFGHEPALRDRFGWPSDRRALGTVALGFADDGPSRSRSAARGRPALDELVHVGRWGSTADDR